MSQDIKKWADSVREGNQLRATAQQKDWDAQDKKDAAFKASRMAREATDKANAVTGDKSKAKDLHTYAGMAHNAAAEAHDKAGTPLAAGHKKQAAEHRAKGHF